ncbi:MAG TPA: SAM-dependent methyltransferase [Pseudonocardiaceae bacterium]|nr:SAM-dependent methyltransferase [Pseudonocardiaceae bacterium]
MIGMSMDQHQRANVTSGVGLTAITAAAARAVESSRPDRLLDDPLATAFVAAANTATPLPVRWPDRDAALSDREILLLHGSGYVGLRTRFGDDELRHACLTGAGQVVVLAAGLDTRAFRIDWPEGVRLFEIDLPSMLEFKDEVLREQGAVARCARTAVAVDLREDWTSALADAGFDAGSPSVWLAEGLLQYLSAGAERALFERIHDLSAPGSHLVVERTVNIAALVEGDNGQRLREISERTGIAMDQLLDTEARPDPAAWLAERGWTVTEHPVATIAQRYGRDLRNPGLPRPSRSPTAAPGSRPAAARGGLSFLCARR